MTVNDTLVHATKLAEQISKFAADQFRVVTIRCADFERDLIVSALRSHAIRAASVPSEEEIARAFCDRQLNCHGRGEGAGTCDVCLSIQFVVRDLNAAHAHRAPTHWQPLPPITSG